MHHTHAFSTVNDDMHSLTKLTSFTALDRGVSKTDANSVPFESKFALWFCCYCYQKERQRVNSFLTAHQHIFGCLVQSNDIIKAIWLR